MALLDSAIVCPRISAHARAHNDYYYRTLACQVRSCMAPGCATCAVAWRHWRMQFARVLLTVRPPVPALLSLSRVWYGMKRCRLGHTTGVRVCSSNVRYYFVSTVVNSCVSSIVCLQRAPHALPHNSNNASTHCSWHMHIQVVPCHRQWVTLAAFPLWM